MEPGVKQRAGESTLQLDGGQGDQQGAAQDEQQAGVPVAAGEVEKTQYAGGVEHPREGQATAEEQTGQQRDDQPPEHHRSNPPRVAVASPRDRKTAVAASERRDPRATPRMP